jgi:hypothetical protein
MMLYLFVVSNVFPAFIVCHHPISVAQTFIFHTIISYGTTSLRYDILSLSSYLYSVYSVVFPSLVSGRLNGDMLLNDHHACLSSKSFSLVVLVFIDVVSAIKSHCVQRYRFNASLVVSVIAFPPQSLFLLRKKLKLLGVVIVTVCDCIAVKYSFSPSIYLYCA